MAAAKTANETKKSVASHPESLPMRGVGAQLQLSEWVAMHLREQIVSGTLKKGEFLRIDGIAKALRVSTTPVREGLLLLQSESFVRLIPRRGFVVNSFSKNDLFDLFWAQATLGAELASRAARKMSDAEVAQLQKIQSDHQGAFEAGDHDRVARIGHQFHRTINLAAQSPRLALLLGSLTRQLPNRFYTEIEGQLKEATEYHPIIIDAIRLKDAAAAGSLMYRHVVAGGEHLIASLERRGIWGPPPPEGKKTAGAVRKSSAAKTAKRRR